MQAVRVTFDGKNFVPDEEVHLTKGQEAMVTFMEEVEYTPKKMSEEEIHAWIKKYSGSCGHMFNSVEEIDEYIKELREDRNV